MKKILMALACGMVTLSTWAQALPGFLPTSSSGAATTPDAMIVYFQDDPQAEGGQQFVMEPKGSGSGTAFYYKKLCMAKVIKGEKGTDPDQLDEPTCSLPMAGIRNGGVTYDADTQRVYVVTQGAEGPQQHVVDPLRLELSAFWRFQHHVNVRSFPLGSEAMEARVSEIRRAYTQTHLLFDACKQVFTRVTGLSEEKTESLFELKKEAALRFFSSLPPEPNKDGTPGSPVDSEQEENFCRLLALKGDPEPLAGKSGASASSLNRDFLRTPGFLGRSEFRYYDQLAAVALFYFLLRLQDIDRAVVERISKIQIATQSAQLGLDACLMADMFRLLDANGNINVNDQHPLYEQVWVGHAGPNNTRLGQLLKDSSVGYTLPVLVSSLRQAAQETSDFSVDSVLRAIERAGQFGAKKVQQNLLPSEFQVLEFPGHASLLSQLETGVRALSVDFGYDISKAFSREEQRRVEEKIQSWFSQTPAERYFPHSRVAPPELFEAFYVGMVGFYRALVLYRDFLNVFASLHPQWRVGSEQELEKDYRVRLEALPERMQQFLTGHPQGGSFLNDKTFLSFKLHPRSPDRDGLLYLNPEPSVLSLQVQRAQVQSVERRSPLACPQINHSGLRSYQSYWEIASELYGHEQFRRTLDKVIPPKSSEDTAAPSVIEKLRDILRDRPGFLSFFMTEEVSGLLAHTQARLLQLLRKALQLPAVDGLIFDEAPTLLGSTWDATAPLPEGFDLGFDLAGPGVTPAPLPRIFFDLVRATRLWVDEYLITHAQELKTRLAQQGDVVEQTARSAALQHVIANDLSDAAVKKVLFGCVTQNSLSVIQGTESQHLIQLPNTCEGVEPITGEVVGYKDGQEFQALYDQWHGFTFSQKFVEAFTKEDRPLSTSTKLSSRQAFRLMMDIQDEINEQHVTAVQKTILQAYTQWSDPLRIARFVKELQAGMPEAQAEIQKLITGNAEHTDRIQAELTRWAQQRYEAMALLQTGLAIRWAILGWVLRELPDVIDGKRPEVWDRPGGGQQSRGGMLAQAKQAFLERSSDPSALASQDLSQLTEEDMSYLKQQDRLWILKDQRGNTGKYYGVTRYALQRADGKAARVYLGQTLPKDSHKDDVIKDQNDLNQGNILLSVFSPGATPQNAGHILFLSQDGKTRVYERPEVLQVRTLKGDRVANTVIDRAAGGMEWVGAGKSLWGQLIDGLLGRKKSGDFEAILNDTVPPAPTAEAPQRAEATQVDTVSGQVIPSPVGYPGRTSQIYQTPLKPEDEAYKKLKHFLTESPRFSMLFEGAFLDTLVFRYVQDPQALRQWTQRLQEWMGTFLDSGHPEIQKETWVSESFSPGLTHKAQFKTHVITLPLMPLLQGYMASEVTTAEISDLRRQLLEADIKLTELEQRKQALDAQDEAGRAQLTQHLQSQGAEYDRLLAKMDAISERDLSAFHMLYRIEASQNNPYFSTHRFLPRNTADPLVGDQNRVIQVVMHEFSIWNIARRSKNKQVLLEPPEVVTHHEDLPLIRSHLLGQYQYHPGAMHHVWDEWDGSQTAQKTADSQCADGRCQNIYFYYGGSHLMAFNAQDGVWFRSEGWNRLGVKISATGQSADWNNMHWVWDRIRRGDLVDQTPMPYRLWLTLPHSPPFFNPLADEWTFQRVFLTKEGVGPVKPTSWLRTFGTWLGLSALSGEGIRPRSWVTVVEALAQPGGEHHLYIQPGMTREEARKAQTSPYQNFMAILWKHFNDVQIYPVPAQNQFLLTHTLKLRPLKQWQFYNHYENAYPNHESYLTAFFTDDTNRNEAKGLYYNSTPMCVQAMYQVKGKLDPQKVSLLNNQIRFSGNNLHQYLLPNFDGPSPEFDEAFDQEFAAEMDSQVGPTVLTVVPYAKGAEPGWLYSTLTGTYDPLVGGKGIQEIRATLQDSHGSWGPQGYSPKDPDRDRPPPAHLAPGLTRLSPQTPNTWIPGMCVPFHTQGAITGMTVVQ